MSTKDWLDKDYYKILGVSKDASAAEIKKAFRKIARESHPDAHPGDKAREATFKAASEANSILSDPAKRKEYDEARSLFGGGGFRFPGAGGFGGGASNVNIDDLFGGAGGGLGDILGGLFGGTQPGRRPGQSSGRNPRRGSDIEGEVTIDFPDAVEGVTVTLQTATEGACTTCHGTGAKPGTQPKACPVCQGSGMQSSSSGGGFSFSEPCRTCRGRGLLIEEPCATCHGSGQSSATRTIQVKIPAGVTDAQRIRIKGRGGAGANGGAAGDLYVLVHVRQHDLFGRKGEHLTLTVPVTFAEAALGAEIEVPTLSGQRVKIRVPSGTGSGRTLRVRGRGVGKADGEHGDLLVTIEVQVPHHLSQEAQDALRAYAATLPHHDVRASLLRRAP
jgi:molecular chaperone DnaJ